MATNRCVTCFKVMDPERKAAGIDKCIKCQPQWAYKGVPDFRHKTGGTVDPVHEAVYANYKKVSARKAKGTHGPSFQRGTTQVFIRNR